jgi:hypothetical protein
LKTTEEICGWTRVPPRHYETWWWNAEVEEAVEKKRDRFKQWRNTSMEMERLIYKEAKISARRVVAQAREIKRQEFASGLDKEEMRKNVFRIAKPMTERQDVAGVTASKIQRRGCDRLELD